MKLPLSLTEPEMMNNYAEMITDNSERDEETEMRRHKRAEYEAWLRATDLPAYPVESRDHNGNIIPLSPDDFPY